MRLYDIVDQGVGPNEVLARHVDRERAERDAVLHGCARAVEEGFLVGSPQYGARVSVVVVVEVRPS